MKKLFVFMMITLFAVSGSSIFAQKNAVGPKNLSRHNALMEQLNLSDQQETKFNQLQTEHQKKAIDLRAQMQKNQLEIKSMMQSGNVDEGKLNNLTDENANLHAQMQKSRNSMWININNMLDDDQKKVWADHFGRMGGQGFGSKSGRGMRNGDCDGCGNRPRSGRSQGQGMGNGLRTN